MGYLDAHSNVCDMESEVGTLKRRRESEIALDALGLNGKLRSVYQTARILPV